LAATAGGLQLVGDLAYRGLGWNGFYMVDIRCPTNPIVVAHHKSVGQVYDLWVERSYAYLAEGWEGLTLVDISRPTQTFYVGKVATRGQARGVEIAGGHVYVAEAGGGLTILGLASAPLTMIEDPVSVSAAAAPCNPERAGVGREPLSYQWYRGETGDTSRPIPGATEPSFTTTELLESCAYWVRVRSASAVGDSQAAWIRPVPPVSVELLSVWPGYRRGPAAEVHVEGNLAYIAAGAGLQIWDLTDLASPRFVGSYEPRVSYLSDMCVAGKTAFLVCDKSLEVLDVSRPEVPSRLCSYTGSDTNAYFSRITVAGRYAYLSEDGFRVVDISNPAQPKAVGILSNAWAECISVRGTYAYLVSGAGLRVVDIANPAQPRLVGTYAPAGFAAKVAVDGNFAYLAEQPRWENQDGNHIRYGGGLVVVDVTDPANPRLAGNLVTGDETYPRDVFVSNNRAYCANGSAGLQIVDVSNPTAPKVIGGCSSNFYAQAVTVSGRHAYLSAGDFGVKVVDISNPASPMLAGFVETAGSAQDVVVSGSNAYLADGTRGLHILDIRNPRLPTALGNYRGTAQSAVVAGSNVFLVPFQVLNVANPTQPKAVANLEEDDAGGTHVTLANSVVYLSGDYRLRTVDVSDPVAPKLLATLPLRGSDDESLVVSALNAYVGCGSGGLQIYDVSVSAEPRRVGTYSSETSVRDVAVDGNFAYVSVSESPDDQTLDVAGLEVIDLADLQRPVRISKVLLPVAEKVALMAGSYACVTGDGLRVVDLGDSAQPVCVGQHQLGTGTSGLHVLGNLAYVAAGEYGLAIYRLAPQLILQPPVRVGTELRLSWLGGPGIRLQRTTSLSNPDWQDVPTSEGASGVRLPLPGAASFFRLIRQ
jgi:hypothetical protein